MPGEATAEAPPRRRASWSLKSIVEDVAGRPIDDFQDPQRPVHPYLRAKAAETAPPSIPEEAYDPVAHLYPPLVGSAGREYHGPEHEHHAETLERHRPRTTADGRPLRAPGPSSRPERLYLHYLLLHVDRLSETGLRYLQAVVAEELAHRLASRAAPAAPEPPAPERPSLPPTA
ncbi:MAG TPA: hypothetical protein VMG36_02535 [Thermoplasmata archaeon]|nr:hypothetical protein [Thermoplasmata archaeon]